MKYLILVTLLTSLSVGFSPAVYADTGYDVTLRVLDAHNAEVKLTYPVSQGMTILTALSSKKNGVMLDGHRDLVSANAQDGSSRTITNNTPITDSQIQILPGDQTITLTYNLTNTLGTDGASMFNFLLFFGKEYPTFSHVHIKTPSDFEIISPSAETDMAADQSAEFLSAKDLSVFVYSKTNNQLYRKDIGGYTLIGAKNKIDEVGSILGKIDFTRDMFKKILGVSLPDRINIIVTPVIEKTSSYEPSARALPPNTILINSNELNFNHGPNDPEKIILHELGHLALATRGIFSKQLFNARWFDEAIAVFSEEYATDNYLLKNEGSRQRDAVLSRFKKMTRQELVKEYTLPFDYNFSINTQTQSIDHTYAHAGLILYNLYLRDTTLIPKILNSLAIAKSNITCEKCDTETVIEIIQRETGLQRNDILYPFKDVVLNDNVTIPRLTIQDIDSATQQKIKEDGTNAVGSYISKDAPVENFKVETPQRKSMEKPEIVVVASTTQNVDNNVMLNDKKSPSIFQRIVLWFTNLFK